MSATLFQLPTSFGVRSSDVSLLHSDHLDNNGRDREGAARECGLVRIVHALNYAIGDKSQH
jgi:hypothetical protein